MKILKNFLMILEQFLVISNFSFYSCKMLHKKIPAAKCNKIPCNYNTNNPAARSVNNGAQRRAIANAKQDG
jgi:hypothetical protein